MSNIDEMLGITEANSDLFTPLDEKDSESLCGGVTREGSGSNEIFLVRNQASANIPYSIDGVRTSFSRSGQQSFWFTDRGGIISFDFDFGRSGVQERRYNLANGRKYTFRRDNRTAYPFDVELFDSGVLS